MIDPVIDGKEDLLALQAKLEAATKVKKGGAKKTVAEVAGYPVASWKFNEWEYYKNLVPCPARGLFTVDEKIVVRGYDKFFNLNEVPSTRTEELTNATKGPYSLTLKENGCIIFISGLENGSIIVCSKHSTGQRADLTRNHAVEGERQVLEQLKQSGHSIEELANTLYKGNITLVAELCDDSFEEHILSYREKDAGLYLHGINFNTITFKTYPMADVENFSKEWGFKCVHSFEIETFDSLMTFLNKCQETGTWQDREIEGFVVRCQKESDFFFKFKFEQPYLLYRNFREVTKQYLSNKPYNDIIKKFTSDKYIIVHYIEFIKEYFLLHSNKKDLYLQGFGIIEVRKSFLQSLGLSEISGINLLQINDQLASTVTEEKVVNKLVFVPVAVIGCGKTTVGQTLVELFKWGHVQNDNIPNGKKNKFVTLSLELLQQADAVIADRNNHQKRERKQLFDQFYSLKLDYISANINLNFICLNFVPRDSSKDEIFNVTYDRISKRGDNHQSIKSQSDPELAQKVMKGFIQRFQRIDPSREPDSEFDLVIDVDFRKDTLTTVKHVISSVIEKYPDSIEKVPSDEEILAAITKSLEYKPEFTKTFGSTAKKEKKKVDFFGVKVYNDLVLGILNNTCDNNDLWKLLKSINRVQNEFHVTLAHLSKAKEFTNEWGKLVSLLGAKKPSSGFHYSQITGTVAVERIVICQNLICMKVEVQDFTNGDQKLTIPYLQKTLHITIGTFEPKIKPVESNFILEKLQQINPSLHQGVFTLDNGLQTQVIELNPPVILESQPLFSKYF